MLKFQSSLEENPEWNATPNATTPFAMFQSSLEENPEWNIGHQVSSSFLEEFQSSLEENPEWNMEKLPRWQRAEVSILTRGKPRVEHPLMRG